ETGKEKVRIVAQGLREFGGFATKRAYLVALIEQAFHEHFSQPTTSAAEQNMPTGFAGAYVHDGSSPASFASFGEFDALHHIDDSRPLINGQMRASMFKDKCFDGFRILSANRHDFSSDQLTDHRRRLRIDA